MRLRHYFCLSVSLSPAFLQVLLRCAIAHLLRLDLTKDSSTTPLHSYGIIRICVEIRSLVAVYASPSFDAWADLVIALGSEPAYNIMPVRREHIFWDTRICWENTAIERLEEAWTPAQDSYGHTVLIHRMKRCLHVHYCLIVKENHAAPLVLGG